MKLARAISDRKQENRHSYSKGTEDMVTLKPHRDVDFSDRPKDDGEKKHKKSCSRLGSEGRSRKDPARDVGYTSPYPCDEERGRVELYPQSSVAIGSSTFYTEDDFGNRNELFFFFFFFFKFFYSQHKKKGTRPGFYKDTLTMPPGWRLGFSCFFMQLCSTILSAGEVTSQVNQAWSADYPVIS